MLQRSGDVETEKPTYDDDILSISFIRERFVYNEKQKKKIKRLEQKMTKEKMYHQKFFF